MPYTKTARSQNVNIYALAETSQRVNDLFCSSCPTLYIIICIFFKLLLACYVQFYSVDLSILVEAT
jgi:hypothetical protein